MAPEQNRVRLAPKRSRRISLDWLSVITSLALALAALVSAGVIHDVPW